MDTKGCGKNLYVIWLYETDPDESGVPTWIPWFLCLKTSLKKDNMLHIDLWQRRQSEISLQKMHHYKQINCRGISNTWV